MFSAAQLCGIDIEQAAVATLAERGLAQWCRQEAAGLPSVAQRVPCVRWSRIMGTLDPGVGWRELVVMASLQLKTLSAARKMEGPN